MDVVFFNEALTAVLGTSCRDMVVALGNKNSKIIPEHIKSQTGKPKILHVAVKHNETIVVNKAQDLSSLQPATPDPKKSATKRGLPESPSPGNIPNKISTAFPNTTHKLHLD